MNKNNNPERNQPSQNGHSSFETNNEADQFVEALETEARLAGSLEPAAAETFEFGHSIRETASQDLPERNESLRKLLIEKLEDGPIIPAAPEKPDSGKVARKPRFNIARIALAASLLLAVSIAMLVVVSPNSPPVLSMRNSVADWLPENYVETAAEIKSPIVESTKAEIENLDELAVDSLKYEKSHEEIVASLNRRVPPSGVSEIAIDDSGIASSSSEPDPGTTVQPVIQSLAKTKKSKGPGSTNWHSKVQAQPNTDPNQLALAVAQNSNGQPSINFGTTANPAAGLLFADANSSSGRGRGGGGIGGGGGGTGGRGAAPSIAGYLPPQSQTATPSIEMFNDQVTSQANQDLSRHLYSQQSVSDGKQRNTGSIGYDFYYLEGKNGGGRGYYERDTGGEQYDPIHENAFTKTVGNKARSTFSIDVDTASYANMRRFLNSHQPPPRNSIRIEELVNYFNYDYPQPEGDQPFSVNMELASCPWNEQNHLLRVGLKGKEIHRNERSASNLVFLLDVSGSMQNANKLPLLKQGLMMLVQQLSENDSVSIVTYAGNAGVVLHPTNGSNKRQIELAIERLNAGGSTNGSAGIQLAYELAQKQFIQDGSNRVIMATDGDLNVGVTSDGALVKLIKEKASEGVFLTVLGFGTGNLKDSKLEKLADNGNGMYAYIDNFREAHKVLVEQMSGSLETIAKDVKIQIEFNPNEVLNYRLIGYENRVLAAKDFDDDKKDAGEIGAGHTVTALYEIVLANGAQTTNTTPQNLKYQSPGETVETTKPAVNATKHDGELLTVSLRYKKPDAQTSQKIEYTLKNDPVSFSSVSADFQFAASVASFGMILRGSQHRGNTSLKWVETTATRAIGHDSGGYRSEFLDLVRKASSFRR